MKDTDSLAHTTWNCKYHIVFAPKYRRKVITLRKDTGRHWKDNENVMREKGHRNH